MVDIKPLIKFSLSGLTSFGLDNALFSFILFMESNWDLSAFYSIAIASTVSRILSGHYNYFVNRLFVFKSNAGRVSYLMYFGLVAVIGFFSWSFTELATMILSLSGVGIAIGKMIVDVVLFIVSFLVQKKFVFKN